MIWITGDTHIPIDIHKLNVSNFIEQKTMTKNDYLIICGDFGGIWDNSKEDEYWLKWLDSKPFTTLFIDGNHENFNLLNEYPVEQFCDGKIHRINNSVFHLMRGQVFVIDGVKIFTMGGATSHDKARRVEGKSWWTEEMPSNNEYEEAYNNLDKHNWCVDLVITHCAPNSIQDRIGNWYEHDRLTSFLEIIDYCLNYNKWFFGHYHTDRQVNKYTAIYRVIERYEQGEISNDK